MLQNMKNKFTPVSLKFKVYLYACTNCKIPVPSILTMLLIEKLTLHSFNSRHVEVGESFVRPGLPPLKLNVLYSKSLTSVYLKFDFAL